VQFIFPEKQGKQIPINQATKKQETFSWKRLGNPNQPQFPALL